MKGGLEVTVTLLYIGHCVHALCRVLWKCAVHVEVTWQVT